MIYVPDLSGIEWRKVLISIFMVQKVLIVQLDPGWTWRTIEGELAWRWILVAVCLWYKYAAPLIDNGT